MGKVYRMRHYHSNTRNCGGKFDQPWTASDRDLITDPERPKDAELAKQLGRSVAAIQAERRRLRNKSSAK